MMKRMFSLVTSFSSAIAGLEKPTSAQAIRAAINISRETLYFKIIWVFG